MPDTTPLSGSTAENKQCNPNKPMASLPVTKDKNKDTPQHKVVISTRQAALGTLAETPQ